jgi:hypothetical protein
MQGQDSIVLLALLIMALDRMERGNLPLVGMLLGLGLFKFQLIIPLIATLTVWKYRKVLVGFIPTATCFPRHLFRLQISGWAITSKLSAT